jgi:hypothetical protein
LLLAYGSLLQQIYPDVYMLKDYLRWFSMAGEAYPDTAISNSILRYIEKEEIKIGTDALSHRYHPDDESS